MCIRDRVADDVDHRGRDHKEFVFPALSDIGAHCIAQNQLDGGFDGGYGAGRGGSTCLLYTSQADSLLWLPLEPLPQRQNQKGQISGAGM